MAHPDKGGSAEAFRSVKNAARVLRGEVSLDELVLARKRVAESREACGPSDSVQEVGGVQCNAKEGRASPARPRISGGTEQTAETKKPVVESSKKACHAELLEAITQGLSPGARVSINELNQRAEWKKILKPLRKKSGLRLNKQTIEAAFAGTSAFEVTSEQGIVWLSRRPFFSDSGAGG